MELCEDISSIANSDDIKFDDYGYLIFGAERGNIIGIQNMHTDGEKLHTDIEHVLNTYISPKPQIYVVIYDFPGPKSWGAIVIEPSPNQPHVFVKEYTGKVQRGDWFVRGISSKERAGPADYQRVFEKRTRQLVEPLRTQLQDQRLRLSDLESKYESALFQALTRALNSEDTRRLNGTENTIYGLGDATGLDLPARLRQRLRKPEDSLARDIIEEAFRLRTLLEAEDSYIPWDIDIRNASTCEELLNSFEKEASTLINSAAEIIASDASNAYGDALCKALSILAKSYSVPIGQPINQPVEYVRHYPLVLVIYAVGISGVFHNQPKILRDILDVRYRVGQKEIPVELAAVRFSLAYADDIFKSIYRNKCEPIGLRIESALQPILAEYYTYENAQDVFLRGEFFMALAGLEARMGEYSFGRIPAPGLYLYDFRATSVLKAFLNNPPDWFDTFYKVEIHELLSSFDETAKSLIRASCDGDGFTTGALEAFKPSKQKT